MNLPRYACERKHHLCATYVHAGERTRSAARDVQLRGLQRACARRPRARRVSEARPADRSSDPAMRTAIARLDI
eukprot:980009-Prymnesium_polylepis.1